MSKATCSLPDCDRPLYCRQMCKPHYEDAQGYGEASRKTPAVCDTCGVEYMRSRKTLTASCPPCAKSNASKKQALAKRKNWPQSRVHFITCQACDRLFASSRKRKYCGSDCWPKAAWPTMPCKLCGAPKELLNTYCEPCRQARSAATRRANKQRRRAIERGVHAERIEAQHIFERDGWRCGICAKSVDTALTYPHPKSASLDHITPISLGGHHVSENVQCAHLVCNVRKGNRAASAQLLLVG